ncbi:flagellar protein FlaG [Sporosarcina sp. JAI121]|uniref:flagellar protein FlaG n=1 Tax=Sporosarcina sp. JAI121 TaxID=2723064 RepID=UPI0015CB7991|nr:flagellar protein FlaG [Sporosarcina sp. JAI121]NYF23943.1 flagellar protein FlaG [Sporosarcina sp. JAI121]
MVSRMDGGSTQQISTPIDKKTPELNIEAAQAPVIQEKTLQQPDNEKQLPADKAKQVTDSMNTFLESSNTQLRFKFHEKLNEYYVTIIDSNTDEVIREIPSKKLLDTHAAMREFVGLLVDRKV